jgi:hypothetical protein
MENAASFDWNRFRSSVEQAFRTLPHFLKNPIEGMKNLPDWDWPTLITLQAAFAAACGMMMQLVQHHIIAAILAFIIDPIVGNVVNLILSGFFFYTFMFFFKRHIPFRTIYTHLLFASIPVFLVTILSPFVPLVGLVGLGAACILLILGFSYNFQLPIYKVRNLIIGIFLLYAFMMAFQLVSLRGGKENLRIRATPESLDILEKELKDDSN